MTTTADTGNTATAVLTATGLVGAAVRVIGELTQEIDSIEDSALNTSTRKTTIPSDLYTAGSVEVELENDVNVPPPAPGTADTLTITQPLEPGSSKANRATIAGTGFVKSRTLPRFENGVLLTAKYVFEFNGKTGPTLTAEST